MQNIIVTTPYRFVPPHPGRFWSLFLKGYLPRYLNKTWGVVSYENQGIEHLENSFAAGHGMLLAPNHCRPQDPMVMGALTRSTDRPTYTMAARHLFGESRWKTWILRRIGAFSVNREAIDREAIKAATAMLVEGQRPLTIFPEGLITRANDRLNPLQDGVAFIARTAAKARAKANPTGKVVIHPVALRYHFRGDLQATLIPVLEKIEKRFSWQPQDDLTLFERICKVGEGLLSCKEIEYFGQAQPGLYWERLPKLIERILEPLEKEWLSGPLCEEPVVERAKRLRMLIVPGMIDGGITAEERARRWKHLADIYLAVQLHLYPRDYLCKDSTPERFLETVERLEEDLTDVATIHRPLHVVLRVGEAIEVEPGRERGQKVDPLMKKLETKMRELLNLS